MRETAAPAMYLPTVDAHGGGMRTIEHKGHTWRIYELDGMLGYEIVGHRDLGPEWVDAPRPLEEMSDVELMELLRSELEPRGVEE